jgi:hypothetical protein
MPHSKDIVLHLAQVDHLFTPPEVTPFSPGWRSVPGVEMIYQQWLNDRRAQTGRLTLYLASSGEALTSPEQIHSAFCRYSDQEIEQNQTSINILRRVARRSAIIGLSILAFFLTGSMVVAQLPFVPEWLATMLQESFIVAAWVAMWRPAELYLYEWRPFKLRIYFLQYLRQLEIEVKPEN